MTERPAEVLKYSYPKLKGLAGSMAGREGSEAEEIKIVDYYAVAWKWIIYLGISMHVRSIAAMCGLQWRKFTPVIFCRVNKTY